LNDVPHLFVYGTLRSEVPNEWSRFLAARAELLGPAKMRGVLFDLGTFPGMIASADAPGFVIGEAFKLNEPSDTSSELDRYEGDDFERRIVSVTLDDGREMEAWAYLYKRDMSDKPPIDSGDYLTTFNR
jgi:gamma-glutamylcyclotransferase (GGCT)/AIG2-like uncharacterized protein YtfP